MNSYQFESEDFALSQEGIHLLRNRFNFKTIRYEEVKKASYLRSFEIKRPLLVLGLGIGLLYFAIRQSLFVYKLFNDPGTSRIYIESILIPIIPGFMGIYCLITSLRKGPLLQLEDGEKVYKLRLRSFFKNKQDQEFRQFLAERIHVKGKLD